MPRVRIRVYLSPAQYDALRARADTEGEDLSPFLASRLTGIIDAAPQGQTAIGLAILQARLDAQREQLGSLERQRKRVERFGALIPKAENAFVRQLRLRVASTLSDIAREEVHVCSIIRSIEKEIRMTPNDSTPIAMASFPLVTLGMLGLPDDWGVNGPLLVLAAIVLFIAYRKRRVLVPWATRFWRSFVVPGDSDDPDEAPASQVRRGIDKGAPRGQSFAFTKSGVSDEEATLQYRHDPRFLRLFLQMFLDQRDGLERLRIFAEDNELEAEGEDAIETVHLFVATEDQIALIPKQVRFQLLSRRGRNLVMEAESEAAGGQPIPVVVTTGPHGNGHSKPEAPKSVEEVAAEARRKISQIKSKARRLAEELGEVPPDMIEGVERGPDGAYRVAADIATPPPEEAPLDLPSLDDVPAPKPPATPPGAPSPTSSVAASKSDKSAKRPGRKAVREGSQ